ncbi:Fe2+-dependent dioxygenase [Paremcibacter congregatus]|uniref:Fe2+-dependent dioxygenase n=1 Tax=Paremcibacter congregatus TaxID=2043170 RepID=UPI003A8E0CF8
MLVQAKSILTTDQVREIRALLENAPWADGKVTAGLQSAMAKNNRQIPEDSPVAAKLQQIILPALAQDPVFNAAALPLRVYPPLFNRYDVGMGFGNHVDNAVRFIKAANMRIRTDVSATLFLSDPDEYDGGDLVIQDTYGEQRVKLAAGDMVIYPATSLHRVEPITRGSRWASFFWTQSMVKDDGQRTLLYDFDRNILEARQTLGEDHEIVLSLTATYHNLLRQWAEL